MNNTLHQFFHSDLNQKRNTVHSKAYNFNNSDFNALTNIINKFFKEELLPNNRYFLLMKVRIEGYGWRTLHHGVIISKSKDKEYTEFVKNRLDLDLEEYNDVGKFEKIIFQTFLIKYSPVPLSRPWIPGASCSTLLYAFHLSGPALGILRSSFLRVENSLASTFRSI